MWWAASAGVRLVQGRQVQHVHHSVNVPCQVIYWPSCIQRHPYRSRQAATPDEMAAIEAFLQRDSACLVICPHYDVGASGDEQIQYAELQHPGDQLVWQCQTSAFQMC